MLNTECDREPHKVNNPHIKHSHGISFSTVNANQRQLTQPAAGTV